MQIRGRGWKIQIESQGPGPRPGAGEHKYRVPGNTNKKIDQLILNRKFPR